MAITLDGTNGINSSGVIVAPDGSASAPSITNDGDTNTGIFFPAADTIAFAEGGAEVARFDSSGNLGIGTSSPSARLVVETSTGDAVLRVHAAENNSSSEAVVKIEVSNDFAESQIIFTDSTGDAGGIYYNHGDNATRFLTNGSERARITSDGVFLVNLSSTAVVTNFMVKATSAGTSVYNSWNSDTSGTRFHFEFRDGANATSRGNITTNGSNTTYATSSDYRLKENVAPLIGALEKVTQLRPSTWTWKENQEEGQGFIAHELAEVIPQAVTGEKDAVDADGNPRYQGVDTSFLVATLTAAIQELKAELDQAKERIAALEEQS